MSRYEWLLFLHVLTAFALVASLVIFTTLLATARDSRPSPLLGISWLGSRLWDVGVLGTLVFGVWMAINIDNYDLLDGWILAALVLWVIAAGAGSRVGLAYRALRDDGAELAVVVRTQQLVMIVAATLLLVDMVFKPGA